MKSLRLRLALWFAASVAAVMGVFVAVTFSHLKHELHVEKWERNHASATPWTLHGNYTDAEIADIVGELWSLSLLYAAPALLLAMSAGYFIARRALRPVHDMNKQLQGINAANLRARVNVADADQEIREIGKSVNSLLVRLENSFHELSEFSAQVAHELRTPLTLMRLQIEESAGRIEPALADSLQEELNRLSEYVEECLLLATAEQGRLTFRRENVALHTLVNDVLEAYRLLATEDKRTIVARIGPAEVETDPRYARQLLYILLGNALHHGEGDIEVTLAAEPAGGATCEVANRIATRRTAAPGHKLGLRLGGAVAGALGVRLQAGAAGPVFRGTLRFPPRASGQPAS